ncbi:MAG: hypothetical protein ACEPOW_06090 [Bacteroidales bacterium]
MAPAYSSSDLKIALEGGKKIIITTIQKFPFIIDGISDLSEKRFAVIIDEAHSSQSGSAHDNMNRAMGQAESESEMDTQDKILHAMKSRKMRGNASYMAFTATPKNTTLEKFGVQHKDGSFHPFHLYSMKQAIEEGFILDVLANYTTYKSYYEIQKSIEDNPEFDIKKAQKKLKSYVEQNQQTIDTKAEIMLDHFMSKVFKPKKLKGKAKGMVVTQSIKSAIRYYKALSRLLDKKGNPFKILVAFSGSKIVDGIEYTESEINGFAEKDTRDKFDQDEYRILVVANKYLTGFDQPKLCTMYVDKKLQSVLAVQALSRLNRSAPKLDKRTEDIFVLDFFNKSNEIKEAFDPFYTSTSLNEATDISVLSELKIFLDEEGVYEWKEVKEFNTKFFNSAEALELSPIIDTAAERFNHELELEDDEKADFKIKAKQFIKIYRQVACIIPFDRIEWEKLFWFLKFLIPKLIINDYDKDIYDSLLNSVDLSTYGIERTKLNESIQLDETNTELDPQNPNPRGAHNGEEEKDFLEEIIKTFNERWFNGWDLTPEDQRTKFLELQNNIKSHPDFVTKVVDNPDSQTSDLAFLQIMNDVISEKRKKEIDFYKLFITDKAFSQALYNTLKRLINRS